MSVCLRFGFGRLFVATLFCLPVNFLSGADRTRPNFLFVYTDDQRWDAMSVVQREMGDRARFPWFQTPNLDRLASQGARFRNAFVVMALCAPSRAAFLTGQYNHRNGVANNFTPFPSNNVTWASLLSKAGYRTAYIGKWHMDSQRGQRPGFDYSASFIGHARYMDAPFEIDGEATPTKGWVDDVSTDYAIEFIRQNRERPWAMAVGYKTPHGPFEPPERWADKFSDGYLKSVPNIDTTPPFSGPVRQGPAPEAGHGPRGALRANLGYFRCVAAVDENVGRLMRALDEAGLTEGTMVVYASDNGFYFGEHRLSDKRSAYDESMRIPLLVRLPGFVKPGTVLDEMVLNIDLAPTLLDFAGLKPSPDMQGRSWRPLLEGTGGNWRQSFFYEYFWEPQRGNPTPTLTAVRTQTAKLIRYQDHPEWTELLDLEKDPYETKNLYEVGGAAQLREKLETEYARLSKAVGYAVPEYASKPKETAAGNPLNRWVLEFRAKESRAGDAGASIQDLSDLGNHGKALGPLVVEEKDGKHAWRFRDGGFIEVPNRPSLNPAVKAWTVEAVICPDKPEGIVLARGGTAFGYALYLADGKPVFAVRVADVFGNVRSETSIVGRWVTLRAGFTAKGEVFLGLDDKPPVTAKLLEPISRDPHDAMQIGADTGAQVLEGEAVPGPFSGWVESVRLFSGEPDQKR